MALEAVVFSQDPLITSYNCCTRSNTNLIGLNYDYFMPNYYPSKWEDSSLQPPFSHVALFEPTNNFFDFPNNDTTTTTPTPTPTTASEFMFENNVPHWNDQQQQPQYVAPSDSSVEEHLDLYGEAPPPPYTPKAAVVSGSRRKRRRRSCKNKEEVEQQRMTHIAVERNRRKQMNEYLSVIRSLMPSSYVQRGDQASIVGGAINYVKELEQALQSVEAQKQRRVDHQHSPPASNGGRKIDDCRNKESLDSCTTEGSEAPPPPPQLFAEFFSFPQYSTRSTTNSPTRSSSGCNSVSSSNSGIGEIEVTMVESHANVKILAKKQPKQLVKLIAGFQGLCLNVLHLNVTTVDSFVLYSFSLKVEEGCQLNSVDDISVAANHILGQIQEEAADHLL